MNISEHREHIMQRQGFDWAREVSEEQAFDVLKVALEMGVVAEKIGMSIFDGANVYDLDASDITMNGLTIQINIKEQK
jgi:hypothetical protein